MAQTRSNRSERLSVALTPEMMAKIREVAAELGLSTNAWAAYTLGSAAAAQTQLREKMSDELVKLMADAVTSPEGQAELKRMESADAEHDEK